MAGVSVRLCCHQTCLVFYHMMLESCLVICLFKPCLSLLLVKAGLLFKAGNFMLSNEPVFFWCDFLFYLLKQLTFSDAIFYYLSL